MRRTTEEMLTQQPQGRRPFWAAPKFRIIWKRIFSDSNHLWAAAAAENKAELNLLYDNKNTTIYTKVGKVQIKYSLNFPALPKKQGWVTMFAKLSGDSGSPNCLSVNLESSHSTVLLFRLRVQNKGPIYFCCNWLNWYHLEKYLNSNKRQLYILTLNLSFPINLAV